MAAAKKRSLGRWALVAGTQQTLSNLFLPFDIYGCVSLIIYLWIYAWNLAEVSARLKRSQAHGYRNRISIDIFYKHFDNCNKRVHLSLNVTTTLV
jgi:hypothetical protein